MIALFVAAATGLLVAGLGTPVLIRQFRRRGIGQQIRSDGPQGHVTKAGTPTPGGIAIVLGVVVAWLAAHLVQRTPFTWAGAMVMEATVGAALVGFADDWIKVRRHRNLGLNKRAKLAGELVVALGFVAGGIWLVHVNTQLAFTRIGTSLINLHQVGWGLWAAFVIIGFSNAVNLTDGLDGLAAGSAAIAFSCLVVVGYFQLRHPTVYHDAAAQDLAIAAVALVGACAGFLWWNAAPAQIFMGDTGALALGAGLGALALEMKIDLLLLVIGGLFVIVTLSVVIQVASFRLFHRRVFRMAPLHHHFELSGWPETTVIVRFWILAGLCSGLALGLFYGDFITLKGSL